MSIINRSVVIIKARQPFVDWLSEKHAEVVDIEEVNRGCPAFLIEDFETAQDALDAVFEEWDVYFETWLESLLTDESDWPEARDETLFREWFDVELHPFVYDRLDEDILHEEEFDSEFPDEDGDDSEGDAGPPDSDGGAGGAGGNGGGRALH